MILGEWKAPFCRYLLINFTLYFYKICRFTHRHHEKAPGYLQPSMVLIMRTLLLVLFPVSEVTLSFNEPITKIGTAQLKSGYVPGDFIIGAVFSVHERPLLSGEGDALSCGSMHEQYGIHRVESAFFAVDKINE